jgi:hypothetical protein
MKRAAARFAVAADIVRFENGLLKEHWDVLQDEATEAESVECGSPSGAVSISRDSLLTSNELCHGHVVQNSSDHHRQAVRAIFVPLALTEG